MSRKIEIILYAALIISILFALYRWTDWNLIVQWTQENWDLIEDCD